MSPPFRFSLILLSTTLVTMLVPELASARGFRVGLMPNGSQNNCSNCHFNAGGGGARNLFGEDVNGLVSRGGREQFWTADFALQDSDDDGFTNGEELGDVDGDGVPERTVNITNAGLADDVPRTAVGDCNLDTVLDGHDLACVNTVADRDAVLTSLNTLAGDLDGNGDVGFADFLVLSGNFSQDLPAYSAGNIDLQGTIDFADFLIMAANFGKTPAAERALSSVPEPGTSLTLLLGAFLLPLARKRQR